MAYIYGIFVYPNDDIQEVVDQFFSICSEVAELEKINNSQIGFDRTSGLFFDLQIADSDDCSVSPQLPCLVLRRGKGAIPYVEGTEDNTGDDFIDVLISVYKYLPKRPAVGYATGPDQSGGIADGDTYYYHPITTKTLNRNSFYDGAWVMFFTPPIVEKYGRETLLDLSARRIDELEDGTIVVVASGDPTMYTEFREIADALNLPAANERPF